MLGATAKSSGSMEGPAVKPLDVGPETMVHLVRGTKQRMACGDSVS